MFLSAPGGLRLLRSALTAGLVAIAGTMAGLPAIAAEADGVVAMTRGGRLYDSWFAETRQKAPDNPHPAYPAAGPLAGDAGETWRCVSCHGWDYRGRDGMKGIDGMAGAGQARVLEVLRDQRHGFGSVLVERDLEALAAFVSAGQVEMNDYVDLQTRRAKGEGDSARVYYQTICANCHGSDGQRLHAIPPLGDVARVRPLSTMHNMLNGHAGETMPSLRMLDRDGLTGLLAHMQSLPTVDPVPSIARGGRLYANWIKEIGGLAPTSPHPSYPLAARYAKESPRTWRCKECHGWDYKGKDGVYAEGNHYTGIKGISGMADADPEAIVAVLTDRTHFYGRILEYRDLLDLANFVSRGQVDVDHYIDRTTGKVNGDPQRSRIYYEAVCANCHGGDGRRVPGLPPLGLMVDENPWAALHSVMNGHPGDNMPAMRGFPIERVLDILAHAQNLPRR